MNQSQAESPIADSGHPMGKCWAAVRDSSVVGLISMSVPSDVDFEQYRERAVACLGLVGEVKAGEIVERDGSHYFVKRLTHAKRSKKPRAPQEYQLAAKSKLVLYT